MTPRRLVLCALASVLLAPLAASARPLPPPPVIVVDKYVTATIDVSYVPGAGFTAVPGGDAAAAYACTTTEGPSAISVVCDKDAGKGYRLTCTIVDIDAYGAFTQELTPRVQADGRCADSTGGVVAALDTNNSTHTHVEHVRRVADELTCAVRVEEASSLPFHTRCTYSATARVPIIGSITMWQDLGSTNYNATTGGVLTTDFNCNASIFPSNAVPPVPPTVTCTAKPSANQWYCDDVFVQASVAPLVTSPSVPQVNGQLSCDLNTGPVAPPGVGYTLSTNDVPTPAGVPVDYLDAPFNHDTDTFICQARGPLDVVVPVAPWKVECAEP
jgi:hypothetical protein